LINGEKLVSSRPIYEYEELLETAGFLRIHQSNLVNKKMIRSYRKQNGGFVVMEDGGQIPVSKSKKDLLKTL
jgi:two-component system LytT family response regulator